MIVSGLSIAFFATKKEAQNTLYVIKSNEPQYDAIWNEVSLLISDNFANINIMFMYFLFSFIHSFILHATEATMHHLKLPVGL